MATTALQPTATPGKTRSFSAKTEAAAATSGKFAKRMTRGVYRGVYRGVT